MNSPVLCDLVLPDVTERFRYDPTRRQQAKLKPVGKQIGAADTKKRDLAPMPSGYGEKRRDTQEFYFELDSVRQGMVERAATIFIPDYKQEGTRFTFKSVVRMIIRAKRWKIPIMLLERTNDSMSQVLEKGKDTFHFNVDAFKVANTGNTGLSKKAKIALMKNPWDRTDDELEALAALANQMKCFTKYSLTVKKQLATIMSLETFEDGRVIIQEGYNGISMYFIVSGSVGVQVSHIDTRTGDKRSYVIGEISAGSSFGELALVQECKRTATVVCKGTSQFLRIDKEDFDMILKRSYEQEWLEKLRLVKTIPFFSDWNEADLRHIMLNCSLKEYNPEKVIVGDNPDETDNLYFILSGSCHIIRQVAIMETTSHLGKGQTMLSLPPPEDKMSFSRRNSKHLTTRFLNIGTLYAGDYFGVGENLESFYILSVGVVECLLVPRYAVGALERISNATGNILTRKFTLKGMKRHVQSRLLSESDVFEKWMANLRWKNYRKKVVNEILTRKPSRVRNKPMKPFTYKDFQLQDRIPPEDGSIQWRDDIVYPIRRKAGYQNATFNLFPLLPTIVPEKVGRPRENKTHRMTIPLATEGNTPARSEAEKRSTVVTPLESLMETVTEETCDTRLPSKTILLTRSKQALDGESLPPINEYDL